MSNITIIHGWQYRSGKEKDEKLKYAEKVHDFGDFLSEVSMRNLSKKLVSLGTCIAICSTAILAGGCSSSKNSSTSNGGKIDM